MKIPKVITIDGPAASGKSTVGQILAQQLHYSYIDAGLLYRGLTALAMQIGLDLSDELALANIAKEMEVQILPPTAGGLKPTILINGKDLTSAMHTPDVEHCVSQVARYSGVWGIMHARERRLGGHGSVVMVGRDIGSVVLPNADLKIFLNASLEERAHRRQRDLAKGGHSTTYEEVVEDIRRRDSIDHSFNYLADDMHEVITDELTSEQVVEHILSWFEENIIK